MQKNNQDTSAVYTPAQAVNIESQNGSKRRRRFVLPAAITFLVVAAIAAWYLLFIADFSRAQAVEAGSNALFFKIDEEGTLWGWRQNDGLLGDGSTTYRERPVKILDNVSQVSAGNNYSMAVLNTGQLFGWGNNQNGQCSLTKSYLIAKPEKVADGVKSVSCCDLSSIYLTKEGKVCILPSY